jgi:hypothetical protein
MLVAGREELSLATFGCRIVNEEEIEEVLSIVCGFKETDPPAIVRKRVAQKQSLANNLR